MIKQTTPDAQTMMANLYETVPSANENEQHDMHLDNTVPGMSDMPRPEPPASLSSHYREPSPVNDIDMNRHIQSTGVQPSDRTEGLLDVRQEQDPLLNVRDRENRNRQKIKRRKYVFLGIFGFILVAISLIITAVIVIPIHVKLSAVNHDQVYNYTSLAPQLYTVLLSEKINGIFTDEVELSAISEGSVSSIGVWLLRFVHTNFTITNGTIPLTAGWVTSPFYALPNSNISIDISNIVDIDNGITITVHRRGYNQPYCETRYTVNITSLHFECLIHDTDFYEVHLSVTNSNQNALVDIILHIKGIDLTNERQSCTITGSNSCPLAINHIGTNSIVLSFNERTSFKIKLSLSQRPHLFLLTIVAIFFIVASIVLFFIVLRCWNTT